MNKYKHPIVIALLTGGLAIFSGGLQALLQPDNPLAGKPSPLATRAKLRQKPKDANVISTIPELKSRAMATKNPSLNRMITAWSNAQQVMGPNAIVYLDQRTGGPLGVQPDGLPWIPGTGMNNRLTRADLEKYAAVLKASDTGRDPPDVNGVNQAVLERIARDFMASHPEWFPVPQNQLQFDAVDIDPNHYVRTANFNQVVNGVQVEGARLVFSVNHGNLVSFGGQFIAPVSIVTTPTISEADAISNAYQYAGVTPEVLSAPAIVKRRIVLDEDGGAVPGGNYAHRLVYAVTFVHATQSGTWEAEVDARTGEVAGFRDTNEYGQIVGGVQPNSNDGICPTGCEQPAYPMPFADYTNTACVAAPPLANMTDSGGNYPASYVGTVNTKLCGTYVRVVNNTTGCPGSAISESVTAPANMNLGTSGGTDCVIPTNGNPTPHSGGDTHAARDAFYNVNKLKELVRGWRPTFAFNNQQVIVNVNVNQTCNATWSGQLNMYKDNGSACRNTGEIAMIFDHELGHGYDGAESGNSRPGEAFADTTASLFHHDACIGRGFFKAQTCGGYGDACTVCTGVRGSDWTDHISSSPHTIFDLQVGNNTAPNTTMECPTGGGDICGFETHCAAYPVTEAVWDAAVIDLPHNPIPPNGGAACAGTSPGNPVSQSQAWNLLAKLFWLSAPTGGDQYTCATNGTAGCGATTLFRIMKIQDDLDGNLTNGTPHAAELQCAFGRHQTGCTTDTNTDQLTCPAIGSPVVTTVPGNGTIQLNWNTVTGVNTWRVMRNEEGCGAGYTVIATLPAATLTYTNTGLQTGRTYFYQVQAVGVNAACEGSPSACVSERPAAYTTPTLTSATASAANQVTASWTNGATPAPRFKIYRDRTTCALADFNIPGNFSPTPLASGLTASPYVDNTVSGGLTYAYAVSGSGTDGLNETDRSNCIQVVPTGTCTIPPTFAGATSITNPSLSTCTLNVNWNAGSNICGSGITYNVYRSTTSGFIPSGANLIASGVTGSPYVDNNGLTNATPYYYVVRGVDSLGNVETNTVQVTGTPNGVLTTIFSDNAGDSGSALMTQQATWTVALTGGSAGPRVYQTGTYAANACIALTSPVINLPAGAKNLSFASRYSIETNWDKGIVEVSTNGGGAWTKLTTVNYPGNSTNTGDGCALGATGASFTGTNNTYATYTGSLAAFSGANSMIRFRLSADVSVQNSGWRIDDIIVSSAAACTTGAPRPPEVTAASPNQLNTSKATNPALVVLSFQDMAGATGYNVYEGNLPIAGAYTHGGAVGNLCAAPTTLAAGRRSTAAAGLGTAGSHYYLVSQYTTVEGSTGFDSSAVEIPIAQSTCAP